MLPDINIFGYHLPMYGTLIIIGFIIAIFLAMRLAPIYNMPKQDVVFASCYAGIGLLVGAKLMYALTFLPKVIKNFDVFLDYPFQVLEMMFGGFVFYGGLIGVLLAVYLYAKHYKIDPLQYANILGPVIPFVHSLGRIGCFLAGCCYGKEHHGFLSVSFPYNKWVEELNEVPRYPVQLMESAANMVLFIGLYIYASKKRKPGRVLGIYLICYTVIRFVMEFFRGDIVRGVFLFGISTSQIISLALLPIGIWLIVHKSSTSTQK